MSDCQHCAALQRQNDFLANDRDGYVQLLTDEITALRAENEKLRAALSGVLWMAEEWFKHGGDETTFADEYEAKLEAARAVITKGEREK